MTPFDFIPDDYLDDEEREAMELAEETEYLENGDA